MTRWSMRIAAAVLIAGGVGLGALLLQPAPGMLEEQQLVQAATDLEEALLANAETNFADDTRLATTELDSRVAELEADLAELELAFAFGLSLESDPDENF